VKFAQWRGSEAGRGWLLAAILIALAVLAPLLSLAWSAANADLTHWAHLLDFVVPQAFVNTVWMLVGVGALVTCLGTGAAWLVTAYDFLSRRVLVWALLLPLAVPTYIIAFAYLDLWHPIGPIQTFIRAALGYDSPRQFRLPDLRSMSGAIFVLGFVLYPYVYLSTRAMFMTQAANLLEAARTLGAGRFTVFTRVALPLARPAIAVGVSLALLETLNDIGASEFLGVQSMTVSIYTTWVTRSDLAGAAQIALAMLILVVALILLERHGRARQRYASTESQRPMRAERLRGGQALLAMTLGWIPVLVGFVLPALYLVSESIKYLHMTGQVSDQLIASAVNTVLIALAATVITVAAGLAVAWAGRSLRDSAGFHPLRACARIASLGYAVPGTVLAIGLLAPLTAIDGLLDGVVHTLTGYAPGLILMGSTGGLLIAYTLRFLAVSTGAVEAGLARIAPSLEQASRLLGETGTGTLKRVHLPLLRPALAAGALLVFVDTMKELPATLLLRPMNFESLATWLYAEAARGTYEEGAIAALGIVVVGLLPVILLARTRLKIGHP